MAMLLTACDEEISDIVVVRYICPQVVKYDRAFLDGALKEYEALPPTSRLKIMIGDYRHLRQKIERCLAKPGAQ